MKLGLIFAAGALAVIPWGAGTHAAEAESEGPVIIAYVFPKDQLIDPAAIAADKLTHINYAFGNVRKGRVVEGFKRDAENFRVLGGLRRAHPHLKILVSVGGWTWSGAFSDAALTPKSRKRFVDSAIAFVLRHDLDGVDIDWEYPGLPGNGNTHRPEDKQNFTALMADLRDALDKAGTPSGRHYFLTFAAGADTDFLEHTEMDKVQASVDFVNLMTYDFREAGGNTEAGHHANLFPSPGDPRHISADRSVNEFLAAGVPAAKLVLGVPFYGRAWGDVKPENDGLFQPGKPPRTHIETHYGNLGRDRRPRTGSSATGTRRPRPPSSGTRRSASSSATRTRSPCARSPATSSSDTWPGPCSGSTTRIRRVRCSARSRRSSGPSRIRE